MRALTSDERKSAWILAGIAATEGTWCLALLRSAGTARFLAYTGLAHGHASASAWIAGLVVTLAFVGGAAARLPSVRENLFTPSRLKLLAVAVAVTAAFCEEGVFRKMLMDGLARGGHGAAMQVLASALAFGVVHGVWGAFRGSLTAAIGATISTGILGGVLAAVYLAGGRDLGPCVIAHFLINVLAEPGLVLAAVRGEMSGTRTQDLSPA